MAMTLRTDEELDNALTALAAAEGLSKQEVIRRAVLDRQNNLDRRQALQRVLDHGHRPSAFGEDACRTLDEKAVALVHSIARNHALVDGNERLALAG